MSVQDISEDTLIRLFPRQHLNSLLASKSRHDGRAFASCRDMRLSCDVVHTVLSSASLSIGRTVVIAGLQATPAQFAVTPDVMFPSQGFFDVSIDLGPACGERFRLGKPSDYACALSVHVHDALLSCGALEFINKEEACIQVRTVDHVLEGLQNFVQFIFSVLPPQSVVADGNLFDACLIAASGALLNLHLPLVEVAPSGAVLQRAGFTSLLLSPSQRLPLSLTFAIIAGSLLVDPCASEEDCSDGLITVVIFSANEEDVDQAPTSVRLHGGATVDTAILASALHCARLRAKQIVSTLNALSKR